MATLSLPVAHSPIGSAAAASYTITSGSVTLDSGSCDIEPGSSLIAQTAINGKGGQITTNGIRMTFTTGGGLGAVAQKAAVIIFGRRLNRRRGALLATMALVAVTAFALGAARAQDATWLPNPTSGDFNTAANWNPASIPNFSTAFFGTSNTTALTFRFDTTVNGWTFNAGASAYTFANNQTLSFNGAGIVINGGSASIRNTHDLNFNFTSTAGNATINNVDFGSVDFTGSSAAGNATINNNDNVFFFNTTTAGNATINNGHNLFFSDNSTGGNAAITNTRSDAVVDFSDSRGLAGDNKLTVGSIAGGGSFQLGRNELTVGGNNMSTDVSGSISGILGSLVKVGTGTLTLSGNANLRGTTVDGGTLAVNGGTFNASNTIVVGSTAGSLGTLNIGAGGDATTQNLIVGQSGVGVLAVQDGGTLTDFGGFVGNLPGSRGTATVSGAGSTWTSTDTIQVGGLGTGTLSIQNGGTVISMGGGSIGLSGSSVGAVTVTGLGSTWNNSPGGGLNIGSFGTGTLSIANGGMVINNTAFTANIGEGANSQGTVTVTGKGSTWSNSSGVNIGKLGTGTLTIADSGIVIAGPIVIATNAGAVGTLNIGSGAGDPAAAPGTLTAPSLAFGAGTGTLNFNHTSADYVFASAINGNGIVNVLAGTTILTGANSYGGVTSVLAGALFVNGDQSGATGATDVAGGATLGGTGTVGGNVSVGPGGTLAPGGVGGGIGTLTVNGSLGLNSGSILNYSFGQAGVVGGPLNDLTVVKDNLTLAGTLNVALTPGGAFDPGLYRVISYGGTLTDNGLSLGSVPPGTTEAVQTSVAHQVNLVNTTGVTLENWDGAATANKNNGVVDGGTGSWQSPAGNHNWTNVAGTLNAPWANAGFATFEAAPGTVTVDNSLGQVVASGLQFAVGGYTLSGAPIRVVETAAGSGATVVRVGDGTAAGTGMTATIASVLQGGTRLVKDDLGTLVLSGANSYSGGTAIDGGAVQVAADSNLGAATGPLSFNGGTLATTASFTSGRATTLDSGGGTLDVAPSTTLTMRGVIDGAGALSKSNAGTLVLTGANSYSGGTTIAAGTLQLGDGGVSGSIVGDVTDNGTLAFKRSDILTFPGVISGAGSVIQAGIGRTIMTADNSYTGGTTIAAGTLQLGTGGTTGGILGNVADNGVLAFDRSDTVTFPGAISGAGSVIQAGSGTTVLTGANSYGGVTSVLAGALFVNGDQSGATGATDVAGGATLGGTGTIGGNVSVGPGGTLAPGGVGGGIGTLTVNGSLGLNSGSILNYSFGQAGVVGGPLNDLTVVKDNLTLAGTLNVALTPGGAFDPGLYRVISYGGTLTDNGLSLGSVPPGTTEAVQTSVAHQVNLVNTTGVTLENWDGAATANKNNGVVDGGTGSWQSPAGNHNWTNVAGTLNAPWANAGFATFEAAPGTVTVDNSLGQVVASGLQFAVGGYTLSGAPIRVVETAAGSGATVVRVGDGTAAGTGMTATIASVLQGGTRLVKDDLGTLVLSGANSYSGGTAIDGGAVQVAADSNLGAATGPLSFNGGTLATTASFTSGRATTLDSGGGTLDVAPSTTLTMRGVIDGAGALSKSNAGTLVLTGANSYSGGTTIAAGTLQLGDGGVSGSIVGDVTDNGTLAFKRSDILTFPGVISGAGSVIQAGIGRTIMTADNSYTGGTTIAAGTLQLGTGGTTGGILGNVADNGVLAFDRSDTVTFPGAISGAGSVIQAGSGTTVLTGANSYGGVTSVLAGALFVNGDQSGATGATDVAGGATLGGTGTVGGNVSVGPGGTLAPGGVGGGIGTLTVNGSLGLNSGSILNYSFGQAGVVGGPLNDLTVVKDNLTLAGTLNVALTPGGAFDPGLYRVISYGGTLTDNGLSLGSVPPGTTEAVQTSVAHQVNLVNTTGVTLENWDGAATANKNNGVVDGGTGSWQSPAGNNNWTNVAGTLNAPWANAGFATFEAAPGTVTVDNSLGQVVASGLQFAVGGYTLTGAPITLVETAAGSGATVVRVGDGTAAGTGMTATIASVLQGGTRLVKDDLGTLVLSGANSYSGGTAIDGGAVQVAADSNLGAATGPLSFNGGTLATTASFTSGRATTLDSGGGTLDVAPSTTLTMRGVIDGAGALSKSNAGTLVLTGANSYSGGTTIAAGTLQLGDGGVSGSIVGDVTDNGTLAFKRSDILTFPGAISGAGSVIQAGIGRTIMTADNSYTGGTTIAAGTLQLGTGGTTGGILGNVADNGVLAFDRSDTVTFPGAISGAGSVIQAGSGTTVLTGANSYGGVTSVLAGALFVNGDQSGATGATDVAGGATLGGTGTIGGNVSVGPGGTLAPGGVGGGIGTLTVNGSLGLNSGSILNYSFGQAGVVGGPLNDLTVVKDNLTLAGTLNVALTPGGGFDPGLYRVISYGGTLTDNGLSLGSVPPGTTEAVQTSVAHQVNLVNTTGVTLENWDGAATANKNNGVVDGGTGSWQSPAGNHNWTNVAGTLNAPWANAGFATFEAAPGTVTVDNSLGQVVASGLQFAVGGYTLSGAPIRVVETAAGSGATVVRVGDGTAAGTGMTATIASVLQGGTRLVKDDLGTLVLSGANSYSGGTAIDGGAVQVAADSNLGAATGPLSFNGGTLATTASFTSGRATTLDSGGGTLDVAPSTTLTMRGVIDGAGALSKSNAGTLVLTGANSYSGGTTIAAGTLQLGDGGTTGSILGDVADNGIFTFNRSDTVTFPGAISGTGSVSQAGIGRTIMTADNSYTGGTTISAGTLQLGNGGTTGSILGDVADNGVLAFDRSDRVSFAGVISGRGSVSQAGGGSTIMTADNSYTGGTTISAGTLQLGNGGTTGSILGDVADNGVLAFDRSDRVSFAGVISGRGSVSQAGGGTTVLTGANSYSGGTTIAAGTLQLGDGGVSGSIVGDVTDNGTLAFKRSDTVTFPGAISGTGSVSQAGIGRTIMTADNSYTGGTTISAGTLQLGTGGTTGGILGNVADNGTLAFDRSDTVTFPGAISGAGSVIQAGSGTTVLTGANSYGGATSVLAGALFVNGDQSGATGATDVAGGATLGGTGTIGGNVSVGPGGTLAPGGVGGGIGTLTVNASLGLNSGSILNYSFGQAGVVGGPLNDLTVVKDNLTLAGTLNVALTPGGAFDPGLYRVISYGGTLTDNGLSLGSVPPGTTAAVQTSVAHQVNLVNTTGVTLENWDGAATANKNNGVVDGGTGSWQSPAGNHNWTNVAGTLNAPWANAGFATFEAAPGTVTVDNSLGQVVASGLQFAVGGYTLSGAPIRVVETAAGSGATVVRVGDGTAAGTGMTATIASVLQGGTRLVKDDLGTLVLSGANSYSGGTAIDGGAVQVAADSNLGAATGPLSFNGGTLATTASFTSGRATTLDSGGGTLDVAPSTTLTMRGVIDGAGALSKSNAGTLVLTGANSYSGGTTIAAGTLQLGDGGVSGSIVGDVTDNGTLAFKRSDTVTFPGAISGTGSVSQAGIGRTIMTADNSYTGGTTISAGTLQLGTGGTTGGILGNVADNGTLAFDRSDTVTFPGAISGAGSVIQAGSGTTVLTGANSYGGATSVLAGALFVNGDQSGATGATDVAGGATLGGTGTIGGNVSVGPGGTLAPGGVGGGIGTLTVNGSLGLNSGSILNYSFGQAGVVGGPLNDLTMVKDNLTLAGTLNVALTPGGAFDPGLYRVISYGGTLTDNGLSLGSVPPGTTEAVQTSVAHQVNLVNTTGVTLENWDGAATANKNNGVVDGGTGSWQSPAGNHNWTNVAGTLNAPWANAGFATFEAAPGTVTVDNSLGQVVASGLQFAVGGYTLSGAPITLVETAAGSGATVVRVGDGTAAGTGMTATIASVLQGGTRLVKDDLGTLVLSGANSYSGGTAIDGGAVQVAADSNLGAATGPLSFNGGTLATTASFTSGRATTLDSGGGTLDVAPSTTLTMRGVIDGAGALSKSNAGTLVLTGANSYSGGTTIAAGTLQLGDGGVSGSIVGDVTDNGTLAFKRSDTVTFPGAISGGGGLAQLGPGTTTLTGANTYSGATSVDAGSLQAGAPNTFSPNSAVTVAGGGTLDLNGFNQTVSRVTNAGLVNLGTGTVPGTVLTTTSYTGAGGTIAMNTFLGGDDSPSDKLVVNDGSATGSSLLRITNAGGPGAETMANGIAVVQAINGGSTAPGAFQLATATDVEVGPFDYRLFHGGVDGSNPGDWFLRSDFVVPPTPTPTPPTPTPPANAFPPQPPPNPLPPGVYPIIGPRLSAYGVAQPIARELGLTELGTLHQRIGDTLTTAYPDGEGLVHSAWGRFFGETIDNRYQAFADPRASGHQVGFQTGLDLWRGSLIPGHRDVAGVYFAYGNSSVDVSGLVTNPAATAYVLQHTGTLNLNAYSGGAYWTHYGPNGWYFDAVLQGTGYGGSATAQSANLPVTTKLAGGGSGFLASLEGGYPVPLQFGPNFILEPQAQIVWQHVSLDPANDGIDTVALGSTSGTTERFGTRAQWTILGGNGAVWQPYARANLWHAGGANAATSFAPSAIEAPLVEQATWLEFAGGVTFTLNPSLSFYAQAGYQFAVAPSNVSRDGFSGNLGLRITW